MKTSKQPVLVHERVGKDGLITFYHHITILGNRERVRLASLGRHKFNSRGYHLAKRSALEAATVKYADIFRGEYGIVENKGGMRFMDLVEEHCAGKAREEMRVRVAREYWQSTRLAQVTPRKVEGYKRVLMSRYANKTAFALLVDSTSGITANVFEASTTDGQGTTTQNPITQDTLDDMLRGAFNEGGDMRNMRYVASPMAYEDIQALQTNNVYSLDKVVEVINAKPFYASKDLEDHIDPGGRTTADKGRVIVGDWEQGLIKADFGLLDIMVNPYSFDSQGKVQLVLHQYFDVQIMDESVFSIYREQV